MRTRREWIRSAGTSLPGVREGGPMRRVVICSPWRGDTALHARYLDACLRDSYRRGEAPIAAHAIGPRVLREEIEEEDRKSTRLNSSHVKISYAVFCL